MKKYLQDDRLSPDEETQAKIDGMREITLSNVEDFCETIRTLQDSIKPRFTQKLHEDLEAAVTPVWEAITKAHQHLKEKYELN